MNHHVARSIIHTAVWHSIASHRTAQRSTARDHIPTYTSNIIVSHAASPSNDALSVAADAVMATVDDCVGKREAMAGAVVVVGVGEEDETAGAREGVITVGLRGSGTRL